MRASICSQATCVLDRRRGRPHGGLQGTAPGIWEDLPPAARYEAFVGLLPLLLPQTTRPILPPPF
eukprot:5107091-Pyramimonas_sp.AAC.1